MKTSELATTIRKYKLIWNYLNLNFSYDHQK